MLALSPTCTANWCYTHISMLHRESSYLALPTVTIVCHNNSILAYSPLERLLPRPPDRNFDTHNNQYNDLNLVIFTSAPNLTNQTHDPLTSILALRFASYIVSQQFAKLLHWVDSNTLLGIFSYQCSWLERVYSLSQPYKHIIPLIWGYVNPLYDIFFYLINN